MPQAGEKIRYGKFITLYWRSFSVSWCTVWWRATVLKTSVLNFSFKFQIDGMVDLNRMDAAPPKDHGFISDVT